MSKLKLIIKKSILYIVLTAILLSTTISSFPLIFKDAPTRSPKSDLPESYTPKSSVAQYETPDQWDDFNFTKGSGGNTGDLKQNDNNYTSIDAEITQSFGSEFYIGSIKPNVDIYSNWIEGDGKPHWKKLDEAPGDMNGDGGNIRDSSSFFGFTDRWSFTSLTLPSGFFITKMIVNMYLKEQTTGPSCEIWMTSSLSGIAGIFDAASTNYVWKSLTFSGLSFTQADLNNFWMQVNIMQSPFTSYWEDIEAVYVEIYISYLTTDYSFDYEITWDITDPVLRPINYLKYDYKTTASVNCELDIYNWDDPQNRWSRLESSSTTEEITDYYILTDSYISDDNEVRIRFKTSNHNNAFEMELDRLCIQCSSPEDWSPETLIGSTNRYFPNIEESKLGFTIETIDIDILSDPFIEFSFKEVKQYEPSSRDVRIYVDGIKIFDENILILLNTSYVNNPEAFELGTPGGHIIEIEICNGIYGNDPHIILEYLKVSGIDFVESHPYGPNNYRFIPMQIYSFDESSDGVIVAISSCIYYDNEVLEIGYGLPALSTEIAFWINPDRDYCYITDYHIEEYRYFINSMKIQWRIIDEKGNFLSYFNLNGNDIHLPQIHPNYNGDYTFYEMEYLLTAFSIFVDLVTLGTKEWIHIPLNILLEILGLLDSTPNPPKTSIHQAESIPPTIEGSWTTGTNSPLVGYGTVPNPECDETSMKIGYCPSLTIKGYYQVQMTWILDLDQHWKFQGLFHEIHSGIELSGAYYYNFKYV
ncbi:MAG: hypothetical protein ACFE9Z_16015 [Promethearchaeota archaeon]